jgi:hypothetical protein
MTSMAFWSYDGGHLPRGGDAIAPRDSKEPAREPHHGPTIKPRPGLTKKEHRMDAARLDHEAAGEGLSERDRQILEFERQWWKYAGAKEQAIRDLFDMSSTRYYQIINTLIDEPQALAFDPMLVKRLRRMRAARQRARSARRLGIEVTGR